MPEENPMIPILLHELKYYFKNKKEAIYIYSFFVSILLLIPFALTPEKSKLQEFGAMSLWVALACATAIAGQSLFARDHVQGRLEYYQLLPILMEGVVLGKWAGFFLFLLLPLLAALPVAGLFYGIEPAALLHHAVGLVAGAAGFSILSCLVAALTTGLEKAGAVLSLILLPLSIPLMIFGAAYCQDISTLWQPELMFMLGFSAFFLPVLCFAGAYSIRNSN
jgi:heme exporter protein B